MQLPEQGIEIVCVQAQGSSPLSVGANCAREMWKYNLYKAEVKYRIFREDRTVFYPFATQ